MTIRLGMQAKLYYKIGGVADAALAAVHTHADKRSWYARMRAEAERAIEAGFPRAPSGCRDARRESR